MLAAMAGHEIRMQLKRPVLLISLLALVSLGLLLPSLVEQLERVGLERINDPYMIARRMLTFSLLTAIVPLLLFSEIVQRDADSGMHEIVRATPARMWGVLAGRFLGLLTVLGLAFALATAAYEAGCRLPWMTAELVGPTNIGAYARTLAIIVLPNLVVLAALAVLISTFSRSRLAALSVLVVLLGVQTAANAMSQSERLRWRASLVNPTGLTAFLTDTRHWTLAERASRPVQLSGTLLTNRLAWLGGSLLLLGLAGWRFNRRESGAGAAFARRPAAAPIPADLPAGPAEPGAPGAHRAAAAAPGRRALPTSVQPRPSLLQMLWTRLGFELGQLFRSWVLYLLLGLSVGLCYLMILTPDTRDMPIVPVAASLVPLLAAGYGLPMYLLALLFAGEQVWRERQARFSEIVDATPVPSVLLLLAKLMALGLVLAVFPLVGSMIGIRHQLANGAQADAVFYAAHALFSGWLPAMMLAVLAMLVHVLIESRLVAHLVAIAIVGIITGIEVSGIENKLALYASLPEVLLSDMNRLGHYVASPFWFGLYWSLFAVLLLLAAHLLRGRGAPAPVMARVRGWRSELTPGIAATGIATLAAFAAAGGFIWWNTRVLNAYDTGRAAEQRAVLYEQTFAAHLETPQPRVSDIDVAIDLWPETRSYRVHGRLGLTNRTAQPIPAVYVHFDDGIGVQSVELEGARGEPGRCCGERVFRLERPMEPGERRALTYRVEAQGHGFRNKETAASVNYNGTFIHASEFSPHIGPERRRFVQDTRRRVALGLTPDGHEQTRVDAAALRRGLFQGDSDLVQLALTVSTSPDQIAVAPGTLRREWSEGGRRHFRYETSQPIVNFWSVISARYSVAEDSWGDVALSVYHHPQHTAHVERMMAGMKLALDYASRSFGPFQHRFMRIVEFPYGNFAQSFPGTVPFAEMGGFIADPDGLELQDHVTLVTAHEVAHQWWGHQLIPADVPGGNMLSESLAEYTALMVMEHRYGRERLLRPLKSNLDKYLKDRGAGDPERPLVRLKPSQPHLAYQKGGLVMYALKETIGEERLNRALARLLREHGNRTDPYASPADLIRVLREEAGPAHHDFIADLLERITLWDIRIESARSSRLDDNRWRFELEVSARKLEADENGAESERPLDHEVTIGLFSSGPYGGYFSRHHEVRQRLRSGRQTIEIVVDAEQGSSLGWASVDPYITLIRRDLEASVAEITRR